MVPTATEQLDTAASQGKGEKQYTCPFLSPLATIVSHQESLPLNKESSKPGNGRKCTSKRI